MATSHNSFDASATLARVRSPLGAFNDLLDLTVAIMIFVDEASTSGVGYTHDVELFDTDLAGYQSTVLRLFRDRSSAVRLGVVQPITPLAGWLPIQPGPDVFDGPNKLFERVQSQRPPTADELLQLFNSITPTLTTEDAGRVDVLVLVDESASMRRDAIAETLEPFKLVMSQLHGDRLAWHDPQDFADRWTNERWLGQAQLRVTQFVQV